MLGNDNEVPEKTTLWGTYCCRYSVVTVYEPWDIYYYYYFYYYLL